MPAITALRANFPDARLTLVVSNKCAALVPAIWDVDQIWTARRNQRALALFFNVAREKFDYCIDFTRTDRSAFLTFLSHAGVSAVYARVLNTTMDRARL